MDDAQPILDYLPASYKKPSEGDYITFLWDTFVINYQSGKYQFAVLASHMLYMSFVFFSVWQIKQSRTEDFRKSLIGFSKDDEKSLLDASSPFSFWTINEARIFRFLKLIGCENNRIGQFARLVQDRNDIAHPNGNISFSNQKSADDKIAEIIKQMDAIQTHMQPVIHECLHRFLLESWNPDKREYLESNDQIREVLIYGNYFSQKDIEVCLAFDIGTLAGHSHFSDISALFFEFVQYYKSENE